MNAYNGYDPFAYDTRLAVHPRKGLLEENTDDHVTMSEAEMAVEVGDQKDVINFSPENDRLIIVYDDFLHPEPTIALEEDEKYFSRTHVTMNGVRIAAIDDANALRLDHIGLMPQSFVEDAAWA